MLYNNNVKTFETEDNGIYVYGPEGGVAHILLYADEGDDNADKWRIQSDTSGNFKVSNYSTGSWVDGLTLDGSNNATFAGTVSDSLGDVRKLTNSTQTSAYTLVAADAGKYVIMQGSGGDITVPDSVFSAGQMITLINHNTSDLTIIKGTNMFYTADGSNTNRTLAGKGMATLLFTDSATCYISGAGLS